ncbi:MAG: RNA polymerase sigma factor [Trinickia sp.]|uniref:RNA polymerase sigma factor n=1 Tax=Trinickia sp. TaxID=2571163 RepID=UPI003F7D5CA3
MSLDEEKRAAIDAAHDVLLLRDFEELTIGEIAARLGSSVPATKSRLHRARTLAREYLLA